MAKRVLNRISIIILVGTAIILGSVMVLYSYSGELLFGNIIHSVRPLNPSPELTPDRAVPEFYKRLSKEKGDFKIIEYPAIVQDRFNPYPFYQSVHQKEILYGYFLSHALKKRWRVNKILDSHIWLAEIVLSRMENNKINFSEITGMLPNFINLYDMRSIKNSGARYVILHRNIKDEIIAVHHDPHIHEDLSKGNHLEEIWRHVNKMASHFESFYKRYLGEPVYENEFLIVFKIG